MGLGIISTLKGFAPLIVYGCGLTLIILCLSGQPKWALLFVTMLIPLRNVLEKLQAYPMGKDFIDILLFFILIGWSMGVVLHKEKFFEKSPINGIAIVIIIYTFFSTLYGSAYLGNFAVFDLSDSRMHLWKNYVLLPILFFVTYNTVRDKVWVWRFVAAICATMVLMDYYTIQQVSWFSSLGSRNKLHGTFEYLGPNEVAAFYNQYTIILMGLFFAMKRGWLKLSMTGLILMNLYCVLFLFSRASYLGLAVGMAILFSIRKKVLLIPLLIAVIFWTTALPDKVIERIQQTTTESGQLDTSSQDRLVMWQISLDYFAESPLIGIGFGVFPKMGYALGDTHNIYCRILAEQGLVGIALFLVLLFIFFSQGLKLYRIGDDELSRGLGIGFAVCIMVLAINNFFGNRWTYMEVSSNLWVFAGLVARLIKISEEAKATTKPPEKPRKLQPLHKRIKRRYAE